MFRKWHFFLTDYITVKQIWQRILCLSEYMLHFCFTIAGLWSFCRLLTSDEYKDINIQNNINLCQLLIVTYLVISVFLSW